MTLCFPGLLLIFMIGNVALSGGVSNIAEKTGPDQLACGHTMLVH